MNKMVDFKKLFSIVFGLLYLVGVMRIRLELS